MSQGERYFWSLSTGDVFVYDNVEYIKLERNETNYNAVTFDGKLCSFLPHEFTKPKKLPHPENDPRNLKPGNVFYRIGHSGSFVAVANPYSGQTNMMMADGETGSLTYIDCNCQTIISGDHGIARGTLGKVEILKYMLPGDHIKLRGDYCYKGQVHDEKTKAYMVLDTELDDWGDKRLVLDIYTGICYKWDNDTECREIIWDE